MELNADDGIELGLIRAHEPNVYMVSEFQPENRLIWEYSVMIGRKKYVRVEIFLLAWKILLMKEILKYLLVRDCDFAVKLTKLFETMSIRRYQFWFFNDVFMEFVLFVWQMIFKTIDIILILRDL